ncbi:MAG TPA: hypothetical protein VF683_01905, partial [Chthoniobacterales bacterium]
SIMIEVSFVIGSLFLFGDIQARSSLRFGIVAPSSSRALLEFRTDTDPEGIARPPVTPVLAVVAVVVLRWLAGRQG